MDLIEKLYGSTDCSDDIRCVNVFLATSRVMSADKKHIDYLELTLIDNLSKKVLWSEKTIIQKIKKNDIIVWCGSTNEDNLSLVAPFINDKDEEYLKTACDNDENNNLLALPEKVIN